MPLPLGRCAEAARQLLRDGSDLLAEGDLNEAKKRFWAFYGFNDVRDGHRLLLFYPRFLACCYLGAWLGRASEGSEAVWEPAAQSV